MDRGEDITTDAQGNVYVTGSFSGTAAFGSTALTASGSGDAFVAKYDHSGNLLWVTSVTGNGGAAGFSIAASAAGEVYVTGVFAGTAAFGSTTLTASGGYDIFVAKYEASGNLVWARSAGGSQALEYGFAIAVDPAGNAYVTGTFRDVVTLGTTTLTSRGWEDMFVAKYDSAGNLLWARSAGSMEFDEGYGIATDAQGNAYVIGTFEDILLVDSTVPSVRSIAGTDVFVVKYDGAGNVVWARGAGGADFEQGLGIETDASGNAYITGEFGGSAAFGTTTLTASGVFDLFVAKYDGAGNLLWARGAGGNDFTEGASIATDGSGNAYVTGRFGGTAVFGATALTASGDSDLFVAKYDGSGNPLWAKSAGGPGTGTPGFLEGGWAVAADAQGNAYVTGSFAETASFDATALISGGDSDVFVVKFAQPGPSCDGRLATIVGSPGNDVLQGTPGEDVIVGLAGNDTIDGRGGDDVICGGEGNDVLRGGWGKDRLFGETGADRLDGGLGDDVLDGGSGHDRLEGDAGNDALSGGDGRDSLDGGLGDDELAGGADADSLDGGFGDDVLDGNAGSDVLDGSVGEDTLNGGDDDDILVGGANNDVLDGGPGNDLLSGELGNDRLRGGSGDDQLLGGPGADQLVCGAGTDVAHGGFGFDTAAGDCEQRFLVP